MLNHFTASAATACAFTTAATAGLTPSSYSIETFGRGNAGEGEMTAMDVATSFFGTTETHLIVVPKDPIDGGVTARSIATVSAIADGWRLDGFSRFAAGSDVYPTSGVSTIDFSVDFFVNAGQTLGIWRDIIDHDWDGSKFAGGGVDLDVLVFRNGALAYSSSFPGVGYPPPQELFSGFESDGAMYRVEIFSRADGDTDGGPGVGLCRRTSSTRLTSR